MTSPSIFVASILTCVVGVILGYGGIILERTLVAAVGLKGRIKKVVMQRPWLGKGENIRMGQPRES